MGVVFVVVVEVEEEVEVAFAISTLDLLNLSLKWACLCILAKTKWFSDLPTKRFPNSIPQFFLKTFSQ